jgi:hypothetical protein
MNRENWIDEVLNSTQGMQQAAAPADMADRAWQGIRTTAATRPGLLRAGIAAAIVLVALNIGSVMHYRHQKSATDNKVPAQETIESTRIYTY